jgi:hypothetical protein
MIVVERGLAEAAFQPRVERVGGIGRDLRAEQIERQ